MYLRRNLRAVWPPNASLYASSTCVHLRLLAGPFGQGFSECRWTGNGCVTKSLDSTVVRVTQWDSQRLSSFHTSCLRKICRIYWSQKITNKELYQRTGWRDITTVIMQRRWRWLGYVIREERDSISRTALRWTPDSGRRKRARSRETWRRTIEAAIKTVWKTWKELEKAAMDREQWKSLVSASCATRARWGLCYVCLLVRGWMDNARNKCTRCHTLVIWTSSALFSCVLWQEIVFIHNYFGWSAQIVVIDLNTRWTTILFINTYSIPKLGLIKKTSLTRERCCFSVTYTGNFGLKLKNLNAPDRNQTFILANKGGTFLKKLWCCVDKTKLSCNTPTDAAPQFL